MLTVEEVEKILKNHDIKIFETVFKKKDGTERHMYFTIDSFLIEKLGIIYKAINSRTGNPDVVNVVELVKKEDTWADAQYRSFRKDSVISLKKAIL